MRLGRDQLALRTCRALPRLGHRALRRCALALRRCGARLASSRWHRSPFGSLRSVSGAALTACRADLDAQGLSRAVRHPLNEGSAVLGTDDALCVFQHDAQRHSMMKVPSRDALRVTRQPYDELIRVCDVFVCGATAAHPIQV